MTPGMSTSTLDQSFRGQMELRRFVSEYQCHQGTLPPNLLGLLEPGSKGGSWEPWEASLHSRSFPNIVVQGSSGLGTMWAGHGLICSGMDRWQCREPGSLGNTTGPRTLSINEKESDLSVEAGTWSPLQCLS